MLTMTEEATKEFPTFLNHDSARSWFKEKYGKNFIMNTVEMLNDEKVYFYHLVSDVNTYVKYMDHDEENITNIAYFSSYQTIKISVTGRVELVH